MPKPKTNFFMNNYMKKYKTINGQVVEDVEVNKMMDNKHEVIKGHYGNMPINIRRTFRKRRSLSKKRRTMRKKPKKTGGAPEFVKNRSEFESLINKEFQVQKHQPGKANSDSEVLQSFSTDKSLFYKYFNDDGNIKPGVQIIYI